MSTRRILLTGGLVVAGALAVVVVQRIGRHVTDDPLAAAVVVVEQKGGKVERDEDLVDHPVVSIRLARVHITDADLQLLEGFPDLRTVRLVATSVTDDGLRQLRHLRGLRTLDLRGTPITDAGLREVRNFPDLEELILLNTRVTGEGLRELAALPKLRVLELPKSCATVRAYQALRDLGLLHYFPHAQKKDMHPATRPEDVYSFRLYGLPAAADGLGELAKELPNLRELQVDADEVTDDTLLTLRDLGLIRTLRPSAGPRTGTAPVGPALTRPGDTDGPSRDEDIRFLDLMGCRAVSDKGLAVLSGLKKLEGLDLSGTAVTARGLQAIAALPKLEELILDFRLTVADLKLFEAQTKLTFPGARFDLTDAGLQELREAGLLHLLLSKAAPASDAAWLGAERSREIDRARSSEAIDSLQPIGELLDRLRPLTEVLARLQPANQPEWVLDLTDVKITDAGLRELKGVNSFSDLVLDGTGVTDAGLADVAVHRRLKCLFLARTKLTGAGLKHLSELKELKLLSLSRTGVTDAGLRHLRGLSSLRVLLLDDTQVTDAGLEDLGELTDLKLLDLSNTSMTDAGLSRLTASKQLRFLVLTGTAVTDVGIRNFRAAVPRCIVVRPKPDE